ncbi:hypothetical protein [Rothia aeria]|jgi:hypothetical protein|uniref:hypothetical protein n=1 Tax=Rothia aeria TaxID=172042 RepID=UPI0028E4FCD8|nr:hypothetical protein [Rothia aeria]
MKNHDDDDLVVGKFFTRAMKIPLMVGRLIDGTRLWGGPYTVPQIVAGCIALLVLWQAFAWFFSTGFILTDAIFVVFGAWGVAYLTGRLPESRRNLFNVISSAATATVTSKTGLYRGTPFKIQQPKLRRPFKTEQQCRELAEKKRHERMRALQQLDASNGSPVPAHPITTNFGPSSGAAAPQTVRQGPTRKSTLESILAARKNTP